MEIQPEAKIGSERLCAFEIEVETSQSRNLRASQCERDHTLTSALYSKQHNGQIQYETPTFEGYNSELKITDNKGLETHSSKKVEPKPNSANLHSEAINQYPANPLSSHNRLVQHCGPTSFLEKTSETAISSMNSQCESNLVSSTTDGTKESQRVDGAGSRDPACVNEVPFITFQELMEAISKGLIQWKDITFHSKIVNSAFERQNQEFC